MLLNQVFNAMSEFVITVITINVKTAKYIQNFHISATHSFFIYESHSIIKMQNISLSPKVISRNTYLKHI